MQRNRTLQREREIEEESVKKIKSLSIVKQKKEESEETKPPSFKKEASSTRRNG